MILISWSSSKSLISIRISKIRLSIIWSISYISIIIISCTSKLLISIRIPRIDLSKIKLTCSSIISRIWSYSRFWCSISLIVYILSSLIIPNQRSSYFLVHRSDFSNSFLIEFFLVTGQLNGFIDTSTS